MKTWQDYYEEACQQERANFQQLPIETILESVKAHRYGAYYTVWEVIAQKASLEEAAPILLEVLERDIDYLIRMNCVEYALLKLMPNCPFSAADLGGDHAEVPKNLAKLKTLLVQTINPTIKKDE